MIIVQYVQWIEFSQSVIYYTTDLVYRSLGIDEYKQFHPLRFSDHCKSQCIPSSAETYIV